MDIIDTIIGYIFVIAYGLVCILIIIWAITYSNEVLSDKKPEEPDDENDND